MAIIKKTKVAEDLKEATAPKNTAVKKAVASKVKSRAGKATGESYRVLLRPMVTEKSSLLASDGVYLFEVAPNTDKVEVRNAVKALYGVTPRRVNIMNRKGKAVRFGRTLGRRKDWRAAYVFLQKGEHIDLHEGV